MLGGGIAVLTESCVVGDGCGGFARSTSPSHFWCELLPVRCLQAGDRFIQGHPTLQHQIEAKSDGK